MTDIRDRLSPLEKRALLALKDGEMDIGGIMEKGGFSSQVEVMNALSWLRSKGLVEIHEDVRTEYEAVRDSELPERSMLKYIAVKGGKASLDEIRSAGFVDPSEVSVGMGWLKRRGWGDIKKEDGNTVLVLTDRGKEALNTYEEDEIALENLRKGESIDPKLGKALKSRKAVKEIEKVERSAKLTDEGRKVVEMGIEIKEEISQLTPEIIRSGKWKELDIRKYDVNAFAPAVYGGKSHPMGRIIDEIREIFISMGFTEIEGDYVQSAFWDMDALFMPQDHPAREMQDTFYLKRPAKVEIDMPEYIEKVKAVHENGGGISRGWGYQWSPDEAQKGMLRTHTTVNSVRYLAEGHEPPFRVMSIGRVFRREAIDSTHLPEFHQIEGIACEEGANLKMLIGLLKEFYSRMGFDEIRVRPAYFPYTEPSLEVEVMFNGKWLELGGAGIFRPEVTETFGVKYPVLAWGLGLERLAMLRLGLKDLRELYNNDLEWLRNAAIIVY